MTPFPLRFATLALAALLTGVPLAPTAQAAVDEVIVPQVAPDGEGNIIVGYNRCPVTAEGGLEPCNGPYTLLVIPTGDPCSRVPAAVPYACGHPGPSTEPCSHAPTAPYLCRDPCESPTTATRPACDAVECLETGWDCPDPCYRPSVQMRPVCNLVDCIEWGYPCPDPCPNVPGAVPYVCGHPGVDTDPCAYHDDAPGTCGNPLPPTDPCVHAPTAPVVCRDPCASPTTATRPACDAVECLETGWDCPDPCYRPSAQVRAVCNLVDCIEWGYPCPDPCPSVPDAVPYVCDHPGLETDPCAYYDDAPGTCGNPGPNPWIVIVDGELCVYRYYLDGTRELITCVPINR